MNPKLSITENDALEICILRIQALSDSDNQGCGVEPEHKEAVRLYLQTWVTPILQAIHKKAADREFNDCSLLNFASRELSGHRLYARDAKIRRNARAERENALREPGYRSEAYGQPR